MLLSLQIRIHRRVALFRADAHSPDPKCAIKKKKKKREKKKRKTLTPKRNKCKLVTFLKSPECESQPKVAVRFEAECSDEFFITPNVVESNGLSSEFIIKTSKHT